MATPRHRLIRRREELGLSRAQVAEALRYDVSAYGRLEQGKLMLRVGRRPTLARVLGWTPAQLAIALDGERVELNGHVVPEWLGHLASVEQGACEIRDFQPFTIHALLQTQDYAAAVERADVTPRTEEEIALRVDARMTRQDVLAREPDPLELRAVLDESRTPDTVG